MVTFKVLLWSLCMSHRCGRFKQRLMLMQSKNRKDALLLMLHLVAGVETENCLHAPIC
jgi:hypothetical protein